jgi:hypothetical protein
VLRVAVPSDVVEVQLVPEGTLEVRLAPDVPAEAHVVRVMTEDGVTVPPASFLDEWAWQRVNGLLTVDVPAGTYAVQLQTARGRRGVGMVEVPPGGRAGVMVGPED